MHTSRKSQVGTMFFGLVSHFRQLFLFIWKLNMTKREPTPTPIQQATESADHGLEFADSA